MTWLVRATEVLRRFPPVEPAFARRVYQAIEYARGDKLLCLRREGSELLGFRG